jgi:tetratricopeptide (TPR) repeat protein
VQWEARTLIKVAMRFKGPIIIVIDSGHVDFQRVKNLHRSLTSNDIHALMLIAARTGPWIAAQRHWGAIPTDEAIEIRERLSESETNALIDKLVAHGFIDLSPITDRAYWLSRADYARRIALVVLLELVQQGRFEEIVLSEYEDLTNDLAERAYRIVSVVHEFGMPIKRELLRRMLGCDWNEFLLYVVQGNAKKVVIEDFETASEQAYYRTKQPVIASIVREHTVGSPMRVLQDLFTQIDDADRADVAMARSILKSERLEAVVPDHYDRRKLFESAVAAVPNGVVIRHQMGINEMDHDYFEEARRVFETCISLSPRNVAVIHSFGLLELEMAKRADPGPLKDLIYNKALKHFERVIELDRHSEYGYHSASAVFLNRARYENVEPEKVSQYIARSLELVDEGLAEIDWREAGRLRNLRGQIFEFLEQYGEARKEYQQSIEDGSASANTYYLLARLELEEDHYEIATGLIDDGLAIFEGDRRLLLLRAEIALRRDSFGRNQLLNVLGPAIRENPKRLSLIFPYAYLLYETGQVAESHKYFKRTADLSQGVFGRAKPRRMFTGKDGLPMIFEGRVERNSPRGRRLMIRRIDNGGYVYFNVPRAIGSGIASGQKVRFNIGFSYLGPIAWDISKSN